jgi:hypothetical protein
MIDIHMRSRQPFFDVDFIDLAMALPISWRRESVIYRQMLLRFFPRFSNPFPGENETTGKRSVDPDLAPGRLPLVSPVRSWLRLGAGKRLIEETLLPNEPCIRNSSPAKQWKNSGAII